MFFVVVAVGDAADKKDKNNPDEAKVSLGLGHIGEVSGMHVKVIFTDRKRLTFLDYREGNGQKAKLLSLLMSEAEQRPAQWRSLTSQRLWVQS